MAQVVNAVGPHSHFGRRGMHEINRLSIGRPAKSPASGRGVHHIPAHVWDDGRVQLGHGTGHLPAAPGLDAEFDASGEQNLHTDATPEQAFRRRRVPR